MRGVLDRPLHTQIDTVRIYRDEHLPYPVQWPELQQLLRRIDRSTPLGARDYAVLLLAATYDPDCSMQDAATARAAADR
jgi:integrase